MNESTDQMPAEDAQLLVDSEVRRRIKAAEWAEKNALPKPVGETLDSALNRLAGLKAPAEAAAKPRVDAGAVQELLAAAEIPKRHLKCELSNDEWKSKSAAIQAKLSTGFICALCGAQGTGKTQMGVQLIRANAALLKTSRFASAMDFFIALKQSYDPDEQASESGVLTRFAKPRLLVLDEMDERGETEWENRLLFHLLNRRYNDMKDTLLISRRPAVEFQASIGKSIASRIQETGGFIVADWPSFRV